MISSLQSDLYLLLYTSCLRRSERQPGTHPPYIKPVADSLWTWPTISRWRSKTKRTFLSTNSISFSLVSSSRTTTLCQITTSRKGLPSTLFSIFMAVCRSLLIFLTSKTITLDTESLMSLTSSRWRSRTRKASFSTAAPHLCWQTAEWLYVVRL